MLFSYAPYPIFLHHDVGCSEMSRASALRVTRKGWHVQFFVFTRANLVGFIKAHRTALSLHTLKSAQTLAVRKDKI